MKWYTCLNLSALDRYIGHLRVAIRSAIDIAGLEPHVVFDGPPDQLRAHIGYDGVQIHPRRTSLRNAIEATPETPGWGRGTAAGALLRLEIPLIETQDEFVLYTDCDVVFLRKCRLEPLRPEFFAAAPMHNPHDWAEMCSGVLLLNIPALRAEYPSLMQHARESLGRPHHYDQEVLNEYFRGRWDHLPLEAHWKPYWGVEPDATILHFHGPKVEDVRRLKKGEDGNPDIRPFYELDVEAYAFYLRLYDALERACLRGEHLSFGAWAAYHLGIWKRAALKKAIHARLRARETPSRLVRPQGKHSFLRSTFDPAVHELATPENFDETAYLLANPDVAAAVRVGRFSCGRAHFRNCGQREARYQNRPEGEPCTRENFEPSSYLALNPDVAFLIHQGRYASAQEHFERRGRRERRRQRRAR